MDPEPEPPRSPEGGWEPDLGGRSSRLATVCNHTGHVRADQLDHRWCAAQALREWVREEVQVRRQRPGMGVHRRGSVGRQ